MGGILGLALPWLWEDSETGHGSVELAYPGGLEFAGKGKEAAGEEGLRRYAAVFC